MKHLLMTIFAISLLASCQNSQKTGETVTGAATKAVEKAASKATSANAKTLMVSPGANLRWIGKKLGGLHQGTIAITNGKVDVVDGKVVSGKFLIDMNSIICTDLEAGKGKEDLEGHLKSPDFFNTAKFPSSTFVITGVNGNRIYGDLTLLGVTKPANFLSTVTTTGSGISVTTPTFEINRTDWGLKYGSATFFDNLKDKAIDDKISLAINFKAA